jgi:glutamate N-acetyltransferase/amino-acid N-acetyltransferase
VSAQDIVVASTGIIGVPLPMQKVEAGIKAAVAALPDGNSTHAAEAIMTTDTFLKECAVALEIDGREVAIGGIAKGSGMIAPNMATMLAVVTTDAAIPADMLREILKGSVDASFNAITVDGDTSTNDMVAVMANGASGVEITGENAGAFRRALDHVLIELAKLIVRDGEGATKFIEITVEGAVSDSDAKKAALAIANSNLVKTAFFGQDPNWGRIVCAAGYSSAEVDQERIDVRYGDVALVKNGTPVDYDAAQIASIMEAKDITVTVDLGLGEGKATVWTCDFSYDYVKINAEYHT